VGEGVVAEAVVAAGPGRLVAVAGRDIARWTPDVRRARAARRASVPDRAVELEERRGVVARAGWAVGTAGAAGVLAVVVVAAGGGATAVGGVPAAGVDALAGFALFVFAVFAAVFAGFVVVDGIAV